MAARTFQAFGVESLTLKILLGQIELQKIFLWHLVRLKLEPPDTFTSITPLSAIAPQTSTLWRGTIKSDKRSFEVSNWFDLQPHHNDSVRNKF